MRKPSLRTSVAIALITSVVLTYQACGQATQFSDPAQQQGTEYNGTDKEGGRGGTTTDNPKATVNLMAMSYSSDKIQSADLCIKELRFNSPVQEIKVASTYQKSGKCDHDDDDDDDDEGSGKSSKKSLDSLKSLINSFKCKYTHHKYHDHCKIGFAAGGEDQAKEAAEEESEESVVNEESYVTTPNNPQQSFVPAGAEMQLFEIPLNTYSAIEIVLKPGCSVGAFKLNKESGSISTEEDGMVMRFEGQFTIKSSGDLKLDLQKFIDQLESIENSDDIKEALNSVRGAVN